jgi:hypothetical protein
VTGGSRRQCHRDYSPSPLADDAPASFHECGPPPASERGSSSGSGSPRAEHEVLAGSPLGAIAIDHEAARSSCEPSRRLEAVKRRCNWPGPPGKSATPRTALISSPLEGVFDVASVCFSLRRGLVISSGVSDVADVADAVPEVNGSGWALASRLLRAHHRTRVRIFSGRPWRHAGSREKRAASNPASTTDSMMTAAVSELALGDVGDAMGRQSTAFGGRSCSCVDYMSPTQTAWSTIPYAGGLEITALRVHA